MSTSQRMKRRTYVHGEKELSAEQQDWIVAAGLDISQRVIVYWPNTANSPTLVGYYDTVSDANAASLAAMNAGGGRPVVLVNWAHPDFTHKQLGPVAHLDATADLPAWYDEDPES